MPKVTYPLSLKVSLWLAANLMLLAILGASFFITQGGVGWSALVAGPSGDRVHALFNVIAGEAAAAAPGPARDAVLARFGEAYGAQFSLHAPGGLALAGQRAALPPALRERLEFRGPPRPFLGGLNRDRGEWPEGTEPAVRSGTGETADGRLTLRPRPDGEGPFRGEGTLFRAAELRPFRFIARTEDPPAYWVGLRVNFALAERERPGRQPPFILLARLDTLPGLLHLLGLVRLDHRSDEIDHLSSSFRARCPTDEGPDDAVVPGSRRGAATGVNIRKPGFVTIIGRFPRRESV